MSILKGTNSGIHAKLTPTYIATFGWKNGNQSYSNTFIKGDFFIAWDEKTGKFTYEFTVGDDNIYYESYEYIFDTYPELKLLEEYLFAKTGSEKTRLLEKIIENSVKSIDFGHATTVFSKLISSEIVSVKQMPEPIGKLAYMDF